MTAQSELDAMDAACRIQNMSAAVGINLALHERGCSRLSASVAG